MRAKRNQRHGERWLRAHMHPSSSRMSAAPRRSTSSAGMSAHAPACTLQRRPRPMPRGVPEPSISPTRPPITTNDANDEVESCSWYCCHVVSAGRRRVSHACSSSVRSRQRTSAEAARRQARHTRWHAARERAGNSEKTRWSSSSGKASMRPSIAAQRFVAPAPPGEHNCSYPAVAPGSLAPYEPD